MAVPTTRLVVLFFLDCAGKVLVRIRLAMNLFLQ
jgi:hypothetical protein